MRNLHRALAVFALLALVAAGAAFAAARSHTSTAARCGAGTVKAIAYVTGGKNGIGSLSGNFSGSGALFAYRWSCSGGAIEVRKPDSTPPGFDVRFAGNPGKVAIGSAVGGPAAVSVSRNADGSFRVFEAGNSDGSSFPIRQDLPFVVIVF